MAVTPAAPSIIPSYISDRILESYQHDTLEQPNPTEALENLRLQAISNQTSTLARALRNTHNLPATEETSKILLKQLCELPSNTDKIEETAKKKKTEEVPALPATKHIKLLPPTSLRSNL